MKYSRTSSVLIACAIVWFLGSFWFVVFDAPAAVVLTARGTGDSVQRELPWTTSLPDAEFITTEGAAWTAAELKGKVAIIDGWASWCAPCVKSFPTLREIDREFSGEGLVVVSLSLDETPMQAAAVQTKYGLPGVVIVSDGNGFRSKEARYFRIGAIPHTELVGPDGRSHQVILDDPALPSVIRALLAKAAGNSWRSKEKGATPTETNGRSGLEHSRR